ncbi:hypothetical protein ARTHRO_41413 [Limnospira indica PCC 8005]|uniref:Uncharacterized protein n=1 Tax=Limnospira indica PCC 8005 TaxID=376219 RepID=A0A9P1P289_9CYAN|nr:hypothetical protein ARTHRO_41413 [Limnospira indica PCC 8005]
MFCFAFWFRACVALTFINLANLSTYVNPFADFFKKIFRLGLNLPLGKRFSL